MIHGVGDYFLLGVSQDRLSGKKGRRGEEGGNQNGPVGWSVHECEGDDDDDYDY